MDTSTEMNEMSMSKYIKTVQLLTFCHYLANYVSRRNNNDAYYFIQPKHFWGLN